MNIELILDERARYIKETEAKFPNTHILLSLLQNNDYAIDKTDRILMYMMYACTREGLSFSSNRKDFLFTECMSQYENLEGKLTNSKGKLIMKSIELPLKAYDLYVKKKYDLAEEMLIKSLCIYNEIFDFSNGEIIWANLEQNLNLLRLHIDSGHVGYVIDNIPQIIDEYFIGVSNGLNSLSKEMVLYIEMGNFSNEAKYHYINYLVDSLLRKITRVKTGNNKEIINSLLYAISDSIAYAHLKPLIQNLTDDIIFDRYYHPYIIVPKVLDLHILKKSNHYLENKEIVNAFLLNVYNFKTE